MKNLGFFLLSFHLGFHIFPPENRDRKPSKKKNRGPSGRFLLGFFFKMAKQSPLLVEVTELFKERKKKLGTKPEPLKSTKLKSEEELEVIKGVLKAELAAYSRADM